MNKSVVLGIVAGIAAAIVIIVGAGFLLMWLSAGGGQGVRGGPMAPDLEAPDLPAEAVADYHWVVKTLGGDDFSLEKVKGQVIFLNFWATWCPPCVAEMPSIQRLYEEVKDNGIAFVCISQEEGSRVKKFVEHYGYTFPVYTFKGDIPSVFASRGIPATFIVGPDGKIAFKHVGSAKWDDERCIAFVKELRG
jgi:thiol-disulfide isomerase/thioredoxin